MLFNSYEFILLFLPLTFFGFFLLSKIGGPKLGNFWLVFVSFFFYGWWDYRYVPLLFGSICFNYFVGKRIENAIGYKPWLVFGIIGNMLLLGYFKYMGFFLDTVNMVIGADWLDAPHIILPLGISFFTFTQTAYLIDAYRGETRNHSFLTYCEFVTIFPHLIAGPIINHREMIPQFTSIKTFSINYKNIAIGTSIFTIGLFKKVVIADALAPWVGDIFARADKLTFIEAWVGALSYTFQLYFDFSGYSEMAIGLALMFNLAFPMNFNSPYKATSMIDFWRRWHMTMGLWVKKYLYIPLGGNRHGEGSKMRNLFISMLLIGLWHGAGWNFVFWGGLHGIFLAINHQWQRLKINLPTAVNWLLTFSCVVVCWVFFRADNFHNAVSILAAMTDVGNIALPAGEKIERYLGFLQGFGVSFISWQMQGSLINQMGILLGIGIILLVSPNPLRIIDWFAPTKKWLVVLTCMFVYAIMKLMNYSEFLYFQF